MGKLTRDQAMILLEKYPDARLHQVGAYYYLDPKAAAQAARYQGVEVVEVNKKDLKATKKVTDGTK